MANLRDIRRRIKSVKNTAQITKAMQLVAASKMKKAQDQAIGGRPYADLLNKVLVNLKEQTSEEDHPLLQERDGDRELVVLVTTDKGLCGPLNTNVIRLVTEQASENAVFVTVGRKGVQALSRLDREMLADFVIKDPVPFLETKQITSLLIEQFLEGKFDTVKVAFTNFVNVMSQDAVVKTLLPIRPIDLGRSKGIADHSDDEVSVDVASGPEYDGYLFEPSASQVLDHIVPQYIANQLYQMILESRASEHSARMVAMKAATDNANQLIKDLTLEYNKQRQAAITAELLEITTAMKALE